MSRRDGIPWDTEKDDRTNTPRSHCHSPIGSSANKPLTYFCAAIPLW